MKIKVNVRGQEFEVEIEDLSTRPVIASIDGERFEVWAEMDQTSSAAADKKEYTPKETEAAVPAKESASVNLAGPSPAAINAPIPGVILSISVHEGDAINPGDELLVLEAMKMKNIITAEKSGRVKKILVSVGDSVRHNQPLIDLEQAGS